MSKDLKEVWKRALRTPERITFQAERRVNDSQPRVSLECSNNSKEASVALL